MLNLAVFCWTLAITRVRSCAVKVVEPTNERFGWESLVTKLSSSNVLITCFGKDCRQLVVWYQEDEGAVGWGTDRMHKTSDRLWDNSIPFYFTHETQPSLWGNLHRITLKLGALVTLSTFTIQLVDWRWYITLILFFSDRGLINFEPF